MIARLLLLTALLTVFADDGSKEGRRGNAHYRAERYGDAAEAYRNGLAQHAENARGAVPAGLMNNLGATFFQTGDFREAQIAFGKSVFMAEEPHGVARGLYNLGNTFATNEELELALTAYREALLAEPDNEDAKFNYEYLKRQFQQQQQQNQDQQQDQQEQQDQEGTSRPEQPDEEGEPQENPDQPQQDEQQPGEQEQNPQQQDQPQDAGTEQPPDEQQPNPDQLPDDELNRQQAERILQALQNEEEQLLRQVQQMKGRPREVDKDW